MDVVYDTAGMRVQGFRGFRGFRRFRRFRRFRGSH